MTVTLSGNGTVILLGNGNEEENIVNGGFENDLNGWNIESYNGLPTFNPIITSDCYSGLKAVKFKSGDNSYGVGQELVIPVSRESVSSFTFMTKGGSPYGSRIWVYLVFTDDTMRLAWAGNGVVDTWEQRNILTMLDYNDGLPLFPSNKTLKILIFWTNWGPEQYQFIDDVSLIERIGHILDFNSSQANNVAVPNWINQSPSIDANIWSKTKERLNYEVRLSDDDYFTLRTLKNMHILLTFSDTTYNISGYVWIEKMEGMDEGDTNWELPWRVSLSLIFTS